MLQIFKFFEQIRDNYHKKQEEKMKQEQERLKQEKIQNFVVYANDIMNTKFNNPVIDTLRQHIVRLLREYYKRYDNNTTRVLDNACNAKIIVGLNGYELYAIVNDKIYKNNIFLRISFKDYLSQEYNFSKEYSLAQFVHLLYLLNEKINPEIFVRILNKGGESFIFNIEELYQ